MKNSLKVTFDAFAEAYKNYREKIDLFWKSEQGRFIKCFIDAGTAVDPYTFSFDPDMAEFKEYISERSKKGLLKVKYR